MKSDFCLTSPNIQSEVGKQGSAIGCSADMSPNGSYFRQCAENMNIRAACNDFLVPTRAPPPPPPPPPPFTVMAVMGSYEKRLLDLLEVPTDFSDTVIIHFFVESGIFIVESGIFSLLGVFGK